MLYVEIAIVVVLICVNGLLSMSELAIVSSRPGSPQGDDRPRRQGRRPRPGAWLQSRQVPVVGADRHHPGRRSVRRLLRRHARRPAGRVPGLDRHSRKRRRPARRRHRRRHHHLFLADRRRTGAQADRAARSRTRRRQGRSGDDHPRHRLGAPGLPARHFRPRHPVAAWPARRKRGEGHRRGDQDAGRRGRASRHHRIRRAAHDRRRHAARRPRRARGDDAAHRGRLDQPAVRRRAPSASF